MAKYWSTTIIWTVLSITQILSMFGILGDINMMLWGYSFMFMLGMSMIVELVRMYIYDSAYSLINADPVNVESFSVTTAAGDTSDVPKVTGASNVITYVESYMSVDSIFESAQFFALASYYMGWWKAQVSMLPEEKTEMDEVMEEVMETFSLFRF